MYVNLVLNKDVILINPEPFPYNIPLLTILKASVEFTYILKLSVLVKICLWFVCLYHL
jgi:hypothetical protein